MEKFTLPNNPEIILYNFTIYRKAGTFAGMEKQLTPGEAFADFLRWVHESGTWKDLDTAERNRIITARRDAAGKRGIVLQNTRIKSILNDYAPDRYRFSETVVLIE